MTRREKYYCKNFGQVQVNLNSKFFLEILNNNSSFLRVTSWLLTYFVSCQQHLAGLNCSHTLSKKINLIKKNCFIECNCLLIVLSL